LLNRIRPAVYAIVSASAYVMRSAIAIPRQIPTLATSNKDRQTPPLSA